MEGFYLLLNTSGSSESDRAVLSLPLPVPAEGQTELCVGFWYYMLGPSVPRLNLVVQNIQFEGRETPPARGSFAIDDVTVRHGVCDTLRVDVCGFDSNLCHFEVDNRWLRRSGTQENPDHTYGTDHGSFMTVLVPGGMDREAQLHTPHLRRRKRQHGSVASLEPEVLDSK
ncbi:hypothetical protein CRUP_006108 [Coryphaenoides rupestris]|nr:hypothetical protein CRUP_006108 [Coryphaenoides rupestris]